MVDIYRTRKGYPYRCLYWKRDETGVLDNEELIHKAKPSGIFYAKNVSSKYTDGQDMANVMRFGRSGLTLETNDITNLNKDDLVFFHEEMWLVIRVNTEPVQKNAEFSSKESYKTFIEIVKGA